MTALRLSPALSLFRPSAAARTISRRLPVPSSIAQRQQHVRFSQSQKGAQQSQAAPFIPQPVPFVPDVETFLKLIGRGLKSQAAKFPSWEAFFSLAPDQLRELDVNPPRARRYLIRWRQRFREGKLGIGGDFKYVEHGVAELRIKEFQGDPSHKRRIVVNTPPRKDVDEIPEDQLFRPEGFRVQAPKTIVGPYALPKAGGGATVRVTEGMWEDRRGHKIDGGERRQAMVRFKRAVAERKAAREASQR